MTDRLKQEVLDELTTNILPFWLSMQDQEHGGYYGQMRGDGTLVCDAPKGGILNARILWAFSAAYRVLRRPEYLEAATRAKDYILDHFVDREYGGTYWEVDHLGRPLDTKKQTYAQGFMLYGLSEYARATGDEEALQVALSLYDTIEKHAWDDEHGGYIEALTRNWQPMEDMRLSDKDANYPKSQNTHLHVIEPYTNLLRCIDSPQRPPSNSPQGGRTKEESSCPLCETRCGSSPFGGSRKGLNVLSEYVAGVGLSIRRLLDIFTERILNPETHHLDLFFTMDWRRGAGALESYGHDIECSWLMHEAALVVGDEALLRHTEEVVREVARASEKGLNADGSMTHEANLDTGHVDADRHWWVQAEAVVGFCNIYQYWGDEAALHKALRCWEYIKAHLVNHREGEWLWSCDAEGRPNREDDLAGFWKCPYHNTRMCLEILTRF